MLSSVELLAANANGSAGRSAFCYVVMKPVMAARFGRFTPVLGKAEPVPAQDSGSLPDQPCAGVLIARTIVVNQNWEAVTRSG